jgi:subtilisin
MPATRLVSLMGPALRKSLLVTLEAPWLNTSRGVVVLVCRLPIREGNMPSTDLGDTLDAAGYAKVIVSLRPTAVAAMAAPAGAPPIAKVDRVSAESSLQNHFIIPSEAQAISLAASARRAASKTLAKVDATATRVRVYPHLGLAMGFVDRSGLASLERDPTVELVVKAPELSLIRPINAQRAKLAATTTWGIRRLKADQLWAAGYTGKGVVVGHLDTGVDGSHPALKGAIAAFAEFDMKGDQVPNAKPWDSDTHGTHTAGTIVGRQVSKGRFGVAPDAQIASGMVIEGGQVIDRILAGFEWIVGKGARVLSMSLGLRGYTTAFQVVIDALRSANVLPVIAVGNEYASSSRSPGNYANVLSIGAMADNNTVADFSSSQRFDRPADPLVPDLVAPGVDVLSCVPGGKYASMDGSSMATPHVAGLAALLLEAASTASATELEDAILKSCVRPSSMDLSRANRGVPDAIKAFEVLVGQPLATVIVDAGRKVMRRSANQKTRRQLQRGKTRVAAGKKKRQTRGAKGVS